MTVFVVFGGLFIGIVLFILMNSLFSVTYFGCGAIVSTFGGCFIAGAAIAMFLGAIIKWIIIIALGVWIISKIVKAAKAN